MDIESNYLISFIKESNKIEGINRGVPPHERQEYEIFLSREQITIDALKQFVIVNEPTAKLRVEGVHNVRVGNYYPPESGDIVEEELERLLKNLRLNTPFENHLLYESLHPFTDCNGRSGRALWLWQMYQRQGFVNEGFLHMFYYQSLSGCASDSKALQKAKEWRKKSEDKYWRKTVLSF